jgi:integrase/recombinase XerD
VVCHFWHAKKEQSHLQGGFAMSASTHQLAASAYHLKPSDLRKLLLSASNFRDRCLIKTLWWLGVRRSELIHLDVRDFDEQRKRMTVHKGKGGKTRVIPIINDEYLSDLLILIGGRKTGPIFLSNRHRAMSLRSVNRIVATLGAQAGIVNPNPRLTHLNPHLFRHSIARFLKSKRFSAEWIQNFLGYESYQTTMDMYGTLSIDEMQEVAERLLD